MRENKPELNTDLKNHTKSQLIGKSPPYKINTYRELIEQTAQLAYLNKDTLLFFRGQTRDYLNKGGESSFYPSIYRENLLSRQDVEYQFRVLENASKQLTSLFSKSKIEGHKDIKNKKYIQWSILQHYEVCQTPLLDFTHSLHVACSFALNESEKGYVYLFGLPYITNRISYNSEHELVNIRLLSICPPDALRPYFQEGYLAGTTDITSDYDSKDELDFNNRLIAKFEISDTKDFWGNNLNKIGKDLLFPKNDQIENLCKEINPTIEWTNEDLGFFVAEWSQLERILLQQARDYESRLFNTREAIQVLNKNEILTDDQTKQIEDLRIFRNNLIHDTKKTSVNELMHYLNILRNISQNLKI